MKPHIRLAVAILTVWSINVPLQAADENSATPPVPTAAAPMVPGLQEEVKQVVDATKAKLRAGGPRNAAAFAEELKKFDAILDAHKGEHTDELAQVLMLKAALYLEVFRDLETGEAHIRRLKAEFAGTQTATKADRILEMLAKKKEAQKVKGAMAPGAAFPDFVEKDMAGEPLSISQYKGKVVLVDFWATWCGPCVAELPSVLAAYEKYHDKGFEIIGISLDKDEAKLKAFIADKKMPWRQYFDGKGWQSKLGQQYGIDSIPATFLLDRDGKIIAKDLRGEALSAELEKVLGK